MVNIIIGVTLIHFPCTVYVTAHSLYNFFRGCNSMWRQLIETGFLWVVLMMI